MKPLIVAAIAALAFAATAGATGDPRKCTTNTGTGPHAYRCAQAAAKAAAQPKLGKASGTNPRYVMGVDCKQNPSLLRWRCQYPASGKVYTALVVFRATSAGWRTTVTVTVA